MNFPPGTEHLYNNTGYDLLSLIILRATGKTLADYARERIFEPLGMKDTRFVDNRTLVIKRRATGYSPTENGGYAVDMPNLSTTGSGGLYTTVKDLAFWDESSYTGSLGGSDLTALVETPGVLEDGTRLTYAFGLTVDTHRGLRRVEHGGSLVGYRAQMKRYPTSSARASAPCGSSETPRDRSWDSRSPRTERATCIGRSGARSKFPERALAQRTGSAGPGAPLLHVVLQEHRPCLLVDAVAHEAEARLDRRRG